MPRVGLFRRSVIKKVRPSARYTGGATAQSFGANGAAGLIEGGNSMQNASSNIMKDAIRDKRIEVAKEEEAQRKAEAEAKQREASLAEATGRDASNAFQKELRNLEREWSQLQGRNAVDAYKNYSTKTDELYNKYSQGLSDKELKTFNYYSGHRYNSSLDNLSKFDLTAQRNFETQTLIEGMAGNTNDLVSSRYDYNSADVIANKISENALDIAKMKGLDEAGTRNFMQSSLQSAHLKSINAMMDDGEFDKASDYAERFKGDMTPGAYADVSKEIYEKGVRAKAPQLVKEEMAKNPNDPAAQLAALDGIKDEKLRELARKEWTVQNEIQKTEQLKEKQERFQGMLQSSLLNSEGNVTSSWNGKAASIDEIDKVREMRDKIISNQTGNLNYYYDVKEQIELGKIENIDYMSIDFTQLTTNQVQSLYKAKEERDKNPGKSENTKYVTTFNEQCKTEISAAGFDEDSKQESRILSKARSRFEHEKLVKKRDLNWDERQKIINDCIGDLTPGEEKQGFFNDNMTLGEAKKQGYEKVFEPDTPEDLASGAQWINDVGAFVRPDNSEFGVTLQDGSGRDITPLNLEIGTKWSTRINRFINVTDNTRKIYDTSGKLIFEMPKEAGYHEQINAFTYADNVSIDGVMKPCVRIYDLNDGRVSLQFRK